MKFVLCALLFASVAGLCRAGPSLHEMLEGKKAGEIWALLVAGSSTWENYRHQVGSCVCVCVCVCVSCIRQYFSSIEHLMKPSIICPLPFLNIILSSCIHNPISYMCIHMCSSSYLSHVQADVCHSYQILHAHGVPDDHIVVMMYNDIAHNEA